MRLRPAEAFSIIVGMASKRRLKLRERDIHGMEFFDEPVTLLKGRHEADCQGDKAGNRPAHFDEYCLFVLPFLFNPIIISLRGIQQPGELKSLGRRRAAFMSLGESADVFEP